MNESGQVLTLGVRHGGVDVSLIVKLHKNDLTVAQRVHCEMSHRGNPVMEYPSFVFNNVSSDQGYGRDY